MWVMLALGSAQRRVSDWSEDTIPPNTPGVRAQAGGVSTRMLQNNMCEVNHALG